MADPTKLEQGMLLLDPNVNPGATGLPVRPAVWAVAKVGARSARLIRYSDGVVVEGTLADPTVPDGWQVINGGALAAALRDDAFDQELSRQHARVVKQVTDIVYEQLDERDGHGPTRAEQFGRIDVAIAEHRQWLIDKGHPAPVPVDRGPA